MLCPAQRTINGTVIDSATNVPLEMASVTLLRKGKPVKFVRTDPQGRFSLSVGEGDWLSATFLGYRKQSQPIPSGNTIRISLVSEAFLLKEVTVKGAPLTGRADTITYDLSRYANQRDNTLNDVLKRLPGIDISKNGTISYQGQPISRFTVEGLDLTGGSYGRMTNRLKAQDVDKAEVIEHDQPVKALQGKLFSDDVALNIKLKDTARDKWLSTIAPSVEVGDDLYPGGSADVLQVGSKRQQMYSVNMDRTGKELSYDHTRLGSSFYSSPEQEISVPSWFSMPSLSAPIDAERLRRNLSHDWGFSRIHKNEQERETLWSANYLHTTEWQQTANTSRYYFGEEPIVTTEQEHMRLSRDMLSLTLNEKVNRDRHYGQEYLHIEGRRDQGDRSLDSDGKAVDQGPVPLISPLISQQTRDHQFYLQNAFKRIFVRDKYQLTVSSDAELSYAPSQLIIDDQQQTLNLAQGYTHNYLSWLRNRFRSNVSLRAGIKADYLDAKDSHLHLTSYLRPAYELKQGKAVWRMNLPIEWEVFTKQHQHFANLSPSLSLNIRQNNRREWYAYGNYQQHSGAWQTFAIADIQTDYRTGWTGSPTIPRTHSLSIGINHTYKRPIREFFWVIRANYSRTRSNVSTDLQIIDGLYRYAYIEQPTRAESYTLNTDLSKGIFDWRLKAKLGLTYAYSRGQQASAGTLLDYTSHTLKATPEITWSPAWCDITYSGSFVRTSTNRLTPLLSWQQSLSLTKTIHQLDLSVSAVHYHNEIQASPTLSTILADAALVWRMKKLRLSLNLHNLLNQREYRQTTYTGLSASTTIYTLRPREIIAVLQWHL